MFIMQNNASGKKLSYQVIRYFQMPTKCICYQSSVRAKVSVRNITFVPLFACENLSVIRIKKIWCQILLQRYKAYSWMKEGNAGEEFVYQAIGQKLEMMAWPSYGAFLVILPLLPSQRNQCWYKEPAIKSCESSKSYANEEIPGHRVTDPPCQIEWMWSFVRFENRFQQWRFALDVTQVQGQTH